MDASELPKEMEAHSYCAKEPHQKIEEFFNELLEEIDAKELLQKIEEFFNELLKEIDAKELLRKIEEFFNELLKEIDANEVLRGIEVVEKYTKKFLRGIEVLKEYTINKLSKEIVNNEFIREIVDIFELSAKIPDEPIPRQEHL